MQKRRTRLLALNAALGGSIVLIAWANQAQALQPSTRARGQYTMVAGEIQSGGDASGIYITDSINEELVVLRWNNSRNQMDGIDFRNLSADANKKPGR